MAHVATTARAEVRVFRAFGEPCGIALYDPASGETGFRFRTHWTGEDAGVLAAIAADLPAKCAEMGARDFFRWVDDTLSTTFRIDSPLPVLYASFSQTLENQYLRRVGGERTGVMLPLHHRRAAAGPFRGEDEDFVEGEVEAQPGVRDGFAVRIQGQSMEPEIPDGCIAIFKPYRAGTRAGAIVLNEYVGEGGLASWVLKRYHSKKRQQVDEFGEVEWEHTSVSMESFNPDFAEFELDETAPYRTIGVFDRVLTD